MKLLVLNGRVVNDGKISELDLLVKDGRIEKIGEDLQSIEASKVVDASGLHILPGMIDDQVHFREPGLVHKGDIATESAAAVAGGITSYMEMPNVSPPTVTREALNRKFEIASRKSIANYSFYLGATHDNIDEIKAVDANRVCGVKVFMGASTGDLLVDDPVALERIFRDCPILIATHCEDSSIIERNFNRALTECGENIPMSEHPTIRDVDCCFSSSSMAVDLAKRHGSDLHVLHLTTARELGLFQKGLIDGKKITAEVCVHHLWFTQDQYDSLGGFIKCNPAIKSKQDRDALRKAVLNDVIDIIATDHAPHSLEEKQNKYASCPSGIPLVQHALPALLDMYNQKIFSLETIVKKMSHNPAIRYKVKERGFLNEGFWADFVLVDVNKITNVSQASILYKCGWSPFIDTNFRGLIEATYVNGEEVFNGKKIKKDRLFGRELEFER